MEYIIVGINEFYIDDENNNTIYEQINHEWWKWEYDENNICISEYDYTGRYWLWGFDKDGIPTETCGSYEI